MTRYASMIHTIFKFATLGRHVSTGRGTGGTGRGALDGESLPQGSDANRANQAIQAIQAIQASQASQSL